MIDYEELVKRAVACKACGSKFVCGLFDDVLAGGMG